MTSSPVFSGWFEPKIVNSVELQDIFDLYEEYSSDTKYLIMERISADDFYGSAVPPEPEYV